MEELKVFKVRDVKTPAKNVDTDAGIDFFIPNYSKEFEEELLDLNSSLNIRIENSKYIFIYPNRDILIPSGIKVVIPRNHCLVGFNRSSVARKLNLDVGACVIDEDYRGEIHIHFFNISDKEVKLEFGQKAVQFLLLPVPRVKITLIEKYEDHLPDRGGGFGSSDKKEEK